MKIDGSRVDTEPTVWGLNAQVWNLSWTGEEEMKKGMLILKRAGFESVEDLPRTAIGFSSKVYQNLPPQLRLSARRMVSKESECSYLLRKDFTSPLNLLCRST